MSSVLVFDWSEDIEIDGVSYCPDHLERARYASFLTNFLIHQDHKKPYVLNLNSGWGTGKTYFLKRWAEELKRTHPVIYIDAWRDDHSDDPFMTVISSIISQLRNKTSYADDKPFIKGVSKSISLFKAIGPLFLGAVVKKYLGKEVSELAAIIDDDSTDLSKDVGDITAKIAQHLISSHDQKSESVRALKQSVIDWIESVIGHNPEITKPTFVIIDELDRCRPTYAVETLEAVKHIFDIPGVFFIIATDTEQLQHAIKVVYGSGFDAQTYLSRFFDSRFSLRQPSLRGLIETHCNIDVLSKNYLHQHQITTWPQTDDQLSNIVSILDAFNMSPRLAIQTVNRIASSILYMSRGNCFDMIYFTILHCMRACDFDMYNKIIGIANLGDISNAFRGKNYVNSKITINMECDVIRRVKLDITLDKYFESIFSYISGVLTDSQGVNFDLRQGGRNEIFKELERKAANSREVDFSAEAFHIKQMQADYLEKGIHRKNKKYYIELVELSASFE